MTPLESHRQSPAAPPQNKGTNKFNRASLKRLYIPAKVRIEPAPPATARPPPRPHSAQQFTARMYTLPMAHQAQTTKRLMKRYGGVEEDVERPRAMSAASAQAVGDRCSTAELERRHRNHDRLVEKYTTAGTPKGKAVDAWELAERLCDKGTKQNARVMTRLWEAEEKRCAGRSPHPPMLSADGLDASVQRQYYDAVAHAFATRESLVVKVAPPQGRFAGTPMKLKERREIQNRGYAAKHVHGAHYMKEAEERANGPPPAAQHRFAGAVTMSLSEHRHIQERMYNAPHVHGAHYIADALEEGNKRAKEAAVAAENKKQRQRDWEERQRGLVVRRAQEPPVEETNVKKCI